MTDGLRAKGRLLFADNFRVFIRDTKADDVLTRYQGVESDVKAIFKRVTTNDSNSFFFVRMFQHCDDNY